MSKSDRVSLRADDAIEAACALRFGIEDSDAILAKHVGDPEFDSLRKSREERWQAYQRIAKALGLKPTLSTGPRKESDNGNLSLRR